MADGDAITYGSVCSGIEAASVAWHDLGWQAAWLAEIEPFPSAVLAHHYPDVPNLGDMTQIAQRVLSSEVAAPDVLVGGTPCQAFSVAGLRNSLADERGNLTLKYVELADAIDHVRRRAGQPEAVIVWENVPGVLSTSDNAFGCFLGALAGAGGELQPTGKRWTDAGCVYGPKRTVAWRILDAQYFGLAQRRRRVFVVASARNGFDPAEVLLERDGMRRDSPPRREAREAVASSLAASAGHHGHSSPRGDGSDKLIADTLRGHPRPGSNSIGATTIHNTELLCVAHGQAGADMGADMGPTLSCNHEAPYIAGTLQASGKAAGSATQQDAESGLLVPMAFSCKDHGEDVGSISPTLRSMGHHGSHANAGGQVAVAFTATDYKSGQFEECEVARSLTTSADRSRAAPLAFAENSRSEVRLEGGDGDRTGALSTGGGKPGQGVPVVAFQSSQSGVRTGDTHATLDANNGSRRHNGVASGMQVRRLTPRECERLQGFPDDYTLIPWRAHQAWAKRKGALHDGRSFEEWLVELTGRGLREPTTQECPDGPRYKALGNSMAVKCMRWIGRRIHRVLAALDGGVA